MIRLRDTSAITNVQRYQFQPIKAIAYRIAQLAMAVGLFTKTGWA